MKIKFLHIIILVLFLTVNISANELPDYCQKDFNVERLFGIYEPTSIIDKHNMDGEKVILSDNSPKFIITKKVYQYGSDTIHKNPIYSIECIKIYKEEGEVQNPRYTYWGGYGLDRDYIIKIFVSNSNKDYSNGWEVTQNYELWDGNGQSGPIPYVKNTYKPNNILDSYKIIEAEYNKQKKFNYLIRFFSLKELDRWFKIKSIKKSTLTTYNNIAYYLEKAKAYKESAYLLEKILEKFPNRTVAYLNLGDAYWGLENKEKAKEAYQTYIKQMKANGKEKKIPKVVLERVK